MRTTDRGLLALARHEGIVPAPYLDVKRLWTFGIGHTAAAGALDPARMPRGMPVDLDAGIAQAFRLFRADLPEGPIPVWAVDAEGRVDFRQPMRRLGAAEALALLRPPPVPEAKPETSAPVAARPSGWLAALLASFTAAFARS
jgi:hypothetical protein